MSSEETKGSREVNSSTEQFDCLLLIIQFSAGI